MTVRSAIRRGYPSCRRAITTSRPSSTCTTGSTGPTTRHLGPHNDGTLEFFNTAAGNLYSDVQRVHIGGTANRGTIRLAATRTGLETGFDFYKENLSAWTY